MIHLWTYNFQHCISNNIYFLNLQILQRRFCWCRLCSAANWTLKHTSVWAKTKSKLKYVNKAQISTVFIMNVHYDTYTVCRRVAGKLLRKSHVIITSSSMLLGYSNSTEPIRQQNHTKESTHLTEVFNNIYSTFPNEHNT